MPRGSHVTLDKLSLPPSQICHLYSGLFLPTHPQGPRGSWAWAWGDAVPFSMLPAPTVQG